MRRRALARLMNKNKTGERGTPRGCHARARVGCRLLGRAAGQGGPVLVRRAGGGGPVLVGWVGGRAGKGFEHGRAVCWEGLDDGSDSELL